jgi:CDP-diacylglycerol--glycerol-3-phosphate 3-phosphatidyltransferase
MHRKCGILIKLFAYLQDETQVKPANKPLSPPRFHMRRMPLYLIYSRLVFSAAILLLALIQCPHYKTYMVILVITGLLTDVFDGIIARKLRISTQLLRRLDSSIDQVFWISVLTSTCICCPQFFRSHYVQLLIVLGVEALTYAISFIKFGKEVATHAISSKIWTLTILATIIQVILTCESSVLFQCCFYLGVITRLEIIVILLILKKWQNDVPSVYHAVQLRKGKEIKRNKFFNG